MDIHIEKRVKFQRRMPGETTEDASITLPLKIATCEYLNCFHEEWTLFLKQWIK